MFAQKRMVAVSLVALAVTATGVVSYMLVDKAGAAPVPAGNAARELERAEREWREQEKRHLEEMVKARLDLANQEEQLRIKEKEANALRSDLKHIQERIESARARYVQPGQVLQGLLDKEQNLSANIDKHRADLLKARQKSLLAQEKVWQLDREQARQRERLRTRLDAAEEKLRVEQGMAPANRSTDLQRRLQDVEQQLERLRRQLAELQRQVKPPSP